jgi:hypothetical protein
VVGGGKFKSQAERTDSPFVKKSRSLGSRIGRELFLVVLGIALAALIAYLAYQGLLAAARELTT